MRKLTRVVEAAMNDASRAEALMRDAGARRALREDPERVLAAFELRGRPTTEATDVGEARSERGRRGARALRRDPATG
ncbi:MAG TPA: hypothetical protein VGR87_13840 [Candidatus Limnocylindria bacterium]|jgi:hypothetical protein|nr:hypothetical protein [Candidatus Limnocylindria bacterium]